jgi:hypothetical protein
MNCAPHHILFGYQIKEDETGGPCGMYGGGGACGEETYRKGPTWKILA